MIGGEEKDRRGELGEAGGGLVTRQGGFRMGTAQGTSRPITHGPNRGNPDTRTPPGIVTGRDSVAGEMHAVRS